MNKEQFLKSLSSSLKRIPAEEREDILQDFTEHFAFGLEEGKTEEEIAAALGSPQKIAKELLATYHLEKVQTTTSIGNMVRAVWAVIGLGFFNLVIVLGPFLAIAGIVLAGWMLSVGFAFSPLLVLLNAIIYPNSFELFDLFFSLVLCGIGLFIAIGTLFVTRKLSTGLIRYLQYNLKLVKGGLKHG